MPNTISRTIRAALLSAIAAFLSLGMLAASVKAQSIDTTGSASGYFTKPEGFSIGQTITAPAQSSVLKGFAFSIKVLEPEARLKMYVYEWDASGFRDTGLPLYVSPELKFPVVDQRVLMDVSGLNLKLVPGKQYLLFGDIEGAGNAGVWDAAYKNAYPAGEAVYRSSSGEPWRSVDVFTSVVNLAFSAKIDYLNPPATPELTLVSRGNGTATFNINLSDSGSSPIKLYQVGCVPEGLGSPVLVESASSPITVSGLTNSTPYLCIAFATNEDNLTGPASAILSVPALSTPEITDPGTLPTGRINQPYSLALQATGGAAPYSWSATGLPAGLTINPATGIISGTPTAAGTSQITVTVTDDAGQEKSAQFTIVVDPLDLTVPVENQTLPGGQVGQAYSASIVVAGGVPPYSFALSGDLPEGLTLNPATGAITGTPTKTQTSTFRVTIEDSTLMPRSAMAKAAVHSITQSFSITVVAVPVVAAPTPVPTLNDWGLLLLSALTIGSAGFFTRKRTSE